MKQLSDRTYNWLIAIALIIFIVVRIVLPIIKFLVR